MHKSRLVAQELEIPRQRRTAFGPLPAGCGIVRGTKAGILTGRPYSPSERIIN